MQELREIFRPTNLNLLFIGESPPAGGTFFYEGNSNLFNYTRQVFSTIFDYQWQDEFDFLHYFQASGCYLEDLCLIPVNNMTPPERRIQRQLGVIPLSERLLLWNQIPQAVVIVGISIEDRVSEAIELAYWNQTPTFVTHFPAFQHQPTFVNELGIILENAVANDWILTPEA